MTEKDYEFNRTNFIKTIGRFLSFGIEKKLCVSLSKPSSIFRRNKTRIDFALGGKQKI